MAKKITYTDKGLTAYDWGEGKIEIKGYTAFVGAIVEVHHKSNGSLDDEPSIAFVIELSIPNMAAVGEISLKMLNDGLSKIGYKLIRE